MDALREFYDSYNEDERLRSKHGQVEYLTTRRYIAECLAACSGRRIIEIGAGTGIYSIALAKEGYDVTAVELFEHNIDTLRSKSAGTDISVIQGNALDLSHFDDNSFDCTLLLGPMYHLFTKEDKIKALSEAVRVTVKGGYILTAYCMNEPTVIQHAFINGNLRRVTDGGLLTDDWHCKSTPAELFDLVRTEEIAELDSYVDAERIKFIASDGAAHYLKGLIDGMDGYTYSKWLEYHFATCERQDCIGASNHTLDILRKR